MVNTRKLHYKHQAFSCPEVSSMPEDTSWLLWQYWTTIVLNNMTNYYFIDARMTLYLIPTVNWQMALYYLLTGELEQRGGKSCNFTVNDYWGKVNITYHHQNIYLKTLRVTFSFFCFTFSTSLRERTHLRLRHRWYRRSVGPQPPMVASTQYSNPATITICN